MLVQNVDSCLLAFYVFFCATKDNIFMLINFKFTLFLVKQQGHSQTVIVVISRQLEAEKIEMLRAKISNYSYANCGILPSSLFKYLGQDIVQTVSWLIFCLQSLHEAVREVTFCLMKSAKKSINNLVASLPSINAQQKKSWGIIIGKKGWNK